MKGLLTLFYLVLLFFLMACDNKVSNNNSANENSKSQNLHHDQITRQNKGPMKKQPPQAPPSQDTKSFSSINVVTHNVQSDAKTDNRTLKSHNTFTVTDIDGTTYKLVHTNQGLRIAHPKQKELLITIFATWCPPCRGYLPYIADIQKKYSDRLITLGVVVNDNISNGTLRQFLKYYNIDFPITRDKRLIDQLVKDLHLSQNHPLPLTIYYRNGQYVMHYEGAVPPEMLEHDLATNTKDN